MQEGKKEGIAWQDGWRGVRIEGKGQRDGETGMEGGSQNGLRWEGGQKNTDEGGLSKDEGNCSQNPEGSQWEWGGLTSNSSTS